MLLTQKGRQVHTIGVSLTQIDTKGCPETVEHVKVLGYSRWLAENENLTEKK